MFLSEEVMAYVYQVQANKEFCYDSSLIGESFLTVLWCLVKHT